MKNIELFIEKNKFKGANVKINKSMAVISPTKDGVYINYDSIKGILKAVGDIISNYGNINLPICLKIGEAEFIDKLSYILIECICYTIIVKYHRPVLIIMKSKGGILAGGIQNSPLCMLNAPTADCMENFEKKFVEDYKGKHFRRIISSEISKETNYLGEIAFQVDNFLKTYGVDEMNRSNVSEVVSELVGNSIEHADTDCLVDIDIQPNYKKINGDEGKYYGVNIAIVNFAPKLLGEDIKKNIVEDTAYGNGRYNTVKKVYLEHEKHFSKSYTQEDLCNITAFQNKISGRRERMQTGGTGLAVLIKSLQERSDTSRCYVFSGKRGIFFKKEMLTYNADGWIGFNTGNDYFKKPPDEGVIYNGNIYIPGTAFNLNFVMKGDNYFV